MLLLTLLEHTTAKLFFDVPSPTETGAPAKIPCATFLHASSSGLFSISSFLLRFGFGSGAVCPSIGEDNELTSLFPSPSESAQKGLTSGGGRKGTIGFCDVRLLPFLLLHVLFDFSSKARGSLGDTTDAAESGDAIWTREWTGTCPWRWLLPSSGRDLTCSRDRFMSLSCIYLFISSFVTISWFLWMVTWVLVSSSPNLGFPNKITESVVTIVLSPS